MFALNFSTIVKTSASLRNGLALILCLLSWTMAHAQEWTAKDSLRLQEILQSEKELHLNPESIEELKRNLLPETSKTPPFADPLASDYKSWLEYDTSFQLPDKEKERPKVVLTLRPYNGQTKYNWDPVYQRKIHVDKNTWRGNPFYELTSLTIYTNWAKTPLDRGPRETVEQIEATGLRYRIEPRGHGRPYGSWQSISNPLGGTDLAGITSREFWAFRQRRTRARTREVLRIYADPLVGRNKQSDTLRINKEKKNVPGTRRGKSKEKIKQTTQSVKIDTLYVPIKEKTVSQDSIFQSIRKDSIP